MATTTTSLNAVLRSAAASAGTVTSEHQNHRVVRKITFAWTTNATGAAEIQTGLISGNVVRACFIPGSGSSQPTNNYDVIIEDEDGIDVLQGTGANLGNINATDVFPALTNGTNGNSIPPAVDSKLTLLVINAGNAKSGTTILYYVTWQ